MKNNVFWESDVRFGKNRYLKRCFQALEKMAYLLFSFSISALISSATS